jgi:hypothetical protein
VQSWSSDAAAAVAGVESHELEEYVEGEKVPVGTVKKIKLWDKTKTLEALGKYLRMFADVLEIRGEISIRGALDEAEARLSAARDISGAVEIVVEKEKKTGQEPI